MKRWITSNVCAAVVSALHAISTTACITVVALSAIALLNSAASAQTEIIRVDGDNGSANPPTFGSGWGPAAYKYLQDALEQANSLFGLPEPPETVQIWVAATGAGNPYVRHNN